MLELLIISFPAAEESLRERIPKRHIMHVNGENYNERRESCKWRRTPHVK